MRQLKLAALLPLLLLFGASAEADEEASLDELLSSFGWDLDSAEIRSEKVSDGLYVLFGVGGNVAASIGEQGVLIVDDQFPELIPQIEAAIRKLGGGSIDFAINTHWHFDHAQGNLALGPAGTWIVSQANSRAMMLKPNRIDLVIAKSMLPPPSFAMAVSIFGISSGNWSSTISTPCSPIEAAMFPPAPKST